MRRSKPGRSSRFLMTRVWVFGFLVTVAKALGDRVPFN
jgi:hypothetical protein